MEDRSRRCGELLFAAWLQALIKLFPLVLLLLARLVYGTGDSRDFLGSADWAAYTVGPALSFKISQTHFVCSEGFWNVYQSHDFACGGASLFQLSE